jgi:tetratricopeptide (TPR) repeat protein
MKSPLRLLPLLALLVLPVFADAKTADLDAATAAWRAGNAAYDQGKFEEAAASYRAAVDAGAADARLYYNQGNALFRLNRLGESVLAYERARKLAPADADIAANLRFVRARLVDKVAEPPSNALTRALRDLHEGYSLRAGLWTAFGLFTFAFAALAAGLFLGVVGRVAATVVSLLAFCALLAFAPSLWLRVRQQEGPGRAVVLDPVAELYSGPGEKHELLFRAHEGTTFDIVERRGEWLSVRLPDGKSGFIRADKTGEV